MKRKHQIDFEKTIADIIAGSPVRKCTGCGQTKSIDYFYRDRANSSGRYPQCKECKNRKTEVWRENNPDYQRQYYRANPEKGRAKTQRWRERHPERYRKSYLDRHAKERATLAGKLDNRTRTGIWKALRTSKAGKPWELLVGYTLEELQRHIGKRFTAGMSWDALMRGEIHIDHKIPRAAFNYETPGDIDFRRCWALKNLRPMWSMENRIKNAKLERPFQPSLAI